MNPGGEATVVWTQLTLPFGERATGVSCPRRGRSAGSFPLVPEVVSAVAPSPYAIASVALPAAGGLVQAAWYEGPAHGHPDQPPRAVATSS